jgi:hypothetical protein
MAAWAEERNLLAVSTVELEQKAVLLGCVFAACQPSEDCDAEKASVAFCFARLYGSPNSQQNQLWSS